MERCATNIFTAIGLAPSKAPKTDCKLPGLLYRQTGSLIPIFWKGEIMKRGLVKRVLIGVLVVILVISFFVCRIVYRVYWGLPQYDGTIHSPHLTHEVKVIRDTWGVPHIKAANEPDAYFALGYCMAQDRLFQMDLLRRIARGELAEIVGPPAVKVDKIMRTLRLRAHAEAYAQTCHERIPPSLYTALHQFICGVNQCIAEQPLPWEFAALMTSCRPFTLADCLAVTAILPITFADGLRNDALKSGLKARYPDHNVDLLFRGIESIPTTIMESFEEAATFQRHRLLSSSSISHEAAEGAKRAVAWLEALAAFGPLVRGGLGSNSWVLAGSKTASGKPILANDPHISFTNPSIWYEAHIHYGDYENYGYHFPPIPVALLGHNEDRGWGITMFANDDVDLYVEKFHPQNPRQVMYKGEWIQCDVAEEELKVRFSRDIVFRVRITPHGPIITDLLEFLLGYEGPPVALSWVWQKFDFTVVDAFYQMNHARDYDAFAAAIPKITSPGLNISYADAAGNIAWWAAGLQPVRPAHVDHKSLLEGWTGNDDIEAYLPIEYTPHLKNPPEGMIVTANNLPTIHPVGEPPLQLPLLQGYFKPSDRAARIKEFLLQRDDWTIEALRQVQTDAGSYAARGLVPILLQWVGPHTEAFEPIEQEAVRAIAQWDFYNGVDSVGSTIFHFWIDALLLLIFGDEMTPTELRWYFTCDDAWIALQDLLAEPNSPWWDSITTPEQESAVQITVAAFKKACAVLRERLGDNLRQWRWGRVHTLTFKHPFGYLPGLGFLFNIGPFEIDGANQTINNMISKSLFSFGVIAGPSTRRLIDFAQPDTSLTILPTGNSGQLGSPHYSDQAHLFVQGKYRTAWYRWEDIEAHKKHELRFVPPSYSYPPPSALGPK